MWCGNIRFHRVGIFEGSPLKERTYTALGLPFISSVKDPYIPDNKSFRLRVEANEDYLDFDKILSFINDFYSDKRNSDEMKKQVNNNY